MKYPFLYVILIIGCSSPNKSVEIEKVSLGVVWEENFPKMLSEWNLFDGSINELNPGEGVIPYDINSSLFSDYAFKARFIKLPEGKSIKYDSTEILDFPIGTILIKNFYYPEDFNQPKEGEKIIETRLLVLEERGWNSLVYKWNKEQTDAKRVVLGDKQIVEWKDKDGVKNVKYSIPSQPQCKSCHDFKGKMKPIGPTARQLNMNNQLQSWKENGLLNVGDEVEYPKLVAYENEKELLDLRARAWLEINCAHCHRREGPAKNSGLYLLASQNDLYKIGVNKPPIAAGKGSGGLKYGIVPGNPDQSILIHRIESLDPGEMMPELGRQLVHKEGVELVRKWIEQMD